MNFPDLETCRQIADEFQNSDFVWCFWKTYFLEIGESVESREDAERGFRCSANGLRVELKPLANAPHCEELGQWLFDHKALVSRFSIARTGWRLLTPDIEEIVEFEAPNETKARSKAVKMVMDALKSNNEED